MKPLLKKEKEFYDNFRIDEIEKYQLNEFNK